MALQPQRAETVKGNACTSRNGSNTFGTSAGRAPSVTIPNSIFISILAVEGEDKVGTLEAAAVEGSTLGHQEPVRFQETGCVPSVGSTTTRREMCATAASSLDPQRRRDCSLRHLLLHSHLDRDGRTTTRARLRREEGLQRL